MNTGVPQGSILGPLIFLLFINDLPMYVNNCDLYADDAMTEATGSTVEDVIWSLQKNIDKLNIWFKHNQLTVNASKCCTLLIGSRQRISNYVNLPSLGLYIDGVQIENRTNYSYLGVNLDSFLTFDYMVEDICNRLSGCVAMFQRISQFMPSECLVKLYNAFIQPYIDYCILIWGVTSSTNRIRVQRFQNTCARIICNNFDNDVTGLSLVRMLGWLNVAQRHDFMLGILVHKYPMV